MKLQFRLTKGGKGCSENEAAAVEHAVQEAVASGQGTKEIGGSLGTRETGDCIVEIIRNRARDTEGN